MPTTPDFQQQAKALVADLIISWESPVGITELVPRIAAALRAAAEQAASGEREECATYAREQAEKDGAAEWRIASIELAIRHRRDPEDHE